MTEQPQVFELLGPSVDGSQRVVARICAACRRGGGGPSDHEPWCPAVMRGPVGLEGQMALELEEGEPR